MGPITVTTAIDAPPERVFDFVADLANRESFMDHFVTGYRLERIPSSGVGAGARFEVDTRGGIWMETVIDGLDRPHRIHERGTTGFGNRVGVEVLYELTDAEMTELSLTFETDPERAVDRLKERFGLEAWYRRQWGKALRRLRDIVEAGPDANVECVTTAGGNPYLTGIP